MWHAMAASEAKSGESAARGGLPIAPLATADALIAHQPPLRAERSSALARRLPDRTASAAAAAMAPAVTGAAGQQRAATATASMAAAAVVAASAAAMVAIGGLE